MYKRYFRYIVSALVALILAVNVIGMKQARASYGTFTLTTGLYVQISNGIPYCVFGNLTAYDSFYAGYIQYQYRLFVNGVNVDVGAGSGSGYVSQNSRCVPAPHGAFLSFAANATDYYFVPPITAYETSYGTMP